LVSAAGPWSQAAGFGDDVDGLAGRPTVISIVPIERGRELGPSGSRPLRVIGGGHPAFRGSHRIFARRPDHQHERSFPAGRPACRRAAVASSVTTTAGGSTRRAGRGDGVPRNSPASQSERRGLDVRQKKRKGAGKAHFWNAKGDKVQTFIISLMPGKKLASHHGSNRNGQSEAVGTFAQTRTGYSSQACVFNLLARRVDRAVESTPENWGVVETGIVENFAAELQNGASDRMGESS